MNKFRSVWKSKRLKSPIAVGFLFILFVVSLIVLLIAIKEDPEPQQQDNEAYLTRVSAIRVEPASYQPSLLLYGQTAAEQDVRLVSAVTGTIDQVMVLEGTKVAKGQALISIDPSDVAISVQESKAELNFAKSELQAEISRHKVNLKTFGRLKELLEIRQANVNRQVILKSRNLGSDASLDGSRVELERAQIELLNLERDIELHPARKAGLEARVSLQQARLARAELELDRHEVRAPFNGVVTRIDVNTGSRVVPGNGMVQLYNRDQIQLKAQLPSRYVALVRAALGENPIQGSFRYAGREWPVTALRLSGQIADRAGGEYVWLTFEKDQSPVSGARGALELNLPAVENAVAVPTSALYRGNRIYMVQEQDGERVLQEQSITILGETVREGERWLLVVPPEGQQALKSVVMTQLPNAISGLPVKVEWQ